MLVIGHVVCHDCSKHRRPLPKFAYDNAVRCCNTCDFHIRMQGMNSSTLASLSLKQLKRYIEYYNLPSQHALEKNDLVKLIFNTRPLTNENEIHYRRLRDIESAQQARAARQGQEKDEFTDFMEDNPISTVYNKISDLFTTSDSSSTSTSSTRNPRQSSYPGYQSQRHQEQEYQRQQQQQQRQQQQRQEQQHQRQQQQQQQQQSSERQYYQYQPQHQQPHSNGAYRPSPTAYHQAHEPAASNHHRQHTSYSPTDSNRHQQDGAPSSRYPSYIYQEPQEHRMPQPRPQQSPPLTHATSTPTAPTSTPPQATSSSPSSTNQQGTTLKEVIELSMNPGDMPIRTLKHLLRSNHVELNFALEKKELVNRVQQLIDDEKKLQKERHHGNDGDNGNDISDDIVCRICYDSQQNCVFLNCGHMVTCIECGLKLVETKNECPICRDSIVRVVRVFRS